MPHVRFTQNIQRVVACPEEDVNGTTVIDALQDYFSKHDKARSCVLDDQGGLRHHMAIFINGKPLVDRKKLSDAVPADATIDVMQALSGG